ARATRERLQGRARAQDHGRLRLPLRRPFPARRTAPLLAIGVPSSGARWPSVPRSPAQLHSALRGRERIPEQRHEDYRASNRSRLFTLRDRPAIEHQLGAAITPRCGAKTGRIESEQVIAAKQIAALAEHTLSII